MECIVVLRRVGVMSRMVILYCPFNIQGRELCLYDFVKITLMWACIRHLQTAYFQTESELHILISAWTNLTFIRGHSFARNQNEVSIFSQI